MRFLVFFSPLQISSLQYHVRAYSSTLSHNLMPWFLLISLNWNSCGVQNIYLFYPTLACDMVPLHKAKIFHLPHIGVCRLKYLSTLSRTFWKSIKTHIDSSLFTISYYCRQYEGVLITWSWFIEPIFQVQHEPVIKTAWIRLKKKFTIPKNNLYNSEDNSSSRKENVLEWMVVALTCPTPHCPCTYSRSRLWSSMALIPYDFMLVWCSAVARL